MLSVLLIGVSLSMDAFAVSVTNGLTLRPFRKSYALWMGLYFGVFQCLMPLAGNMLGSTVSGRVTALEALSPDEEQGMTRLSHRKLLAMAVATSIDALAVGVSFAFSPPAMGVAAGCVLIGCTTFVISAAGALLAGKIPGLHPRRAGIIGGAVLVLIGVKLLLEGILS